MKTRIKAKPNLVLIKGRGERLGPISRLGLWDRFPKVRSQDALFFAAANLLLLASLIYLAYGS